MRYWILESFARGSWLRWVLVSAIISLTFVEMRNEFCGRGALGLQDLLRRSRDV